MKKITPLRRMVQSDVPVKIRLAFMFARTKTARLLHYQSESINDHQCFFTCFFHKITKVKIQVKIHAIWGWPTAKTIPSPGVLFILTLCLLFGRILLLSILNHTNNESITTHVLIDLGSGNRIGMHLID